MNKVFTEENGCYKIDCSKAIWATDSLNHQYHSANCLLSDVDWIMETNQKYILLNIKMLIFLVLKSQKLLYRRMIKQ